MRESVPYTGRGVNPGLKGATLGLKRSKTKSWDMTWGSIPPTGAPGSVDTKNTIFEILGIAAPVNRRVHSTLAPPKSLKMDFEDDRGSFFTPIENQIKGFFKIRKKRQNPPPTYLVSHHSYHVVGVRGVITITGIKQGV